MTILLRSIVLPALILVVGLVSPTRAAAQVTLDEGRYRILIDGREAGTEVFTILRDGIGAEATILATLQIDHGPGELAMRPLLAADSRLEPTRYQNTVSGSRVADVTLTRNGRRFSATVVSERGEAVREFRAVSGARILEPRVATLYWFLGPVLSEAGAEIPIVEPEDGGRRVLVVENVERGTYRFGREEVGVRIIRLSSGDGDLRTLWIDDDGRILRVEVPAESFIAEREPER